MILCDYRYVWERARQPPRLDRKTQALNVNQVSAPTFKDVDDTRATNPPTRSRFSDEPEWQPFMMNLHILRSAYIGRDLGATALERGDVFNQGGPLSQYFNGREPFGGRVKKDVCDANLSCPCEIPVT